MSATDDQGPFRGVIDPLGAHRTRMTLHRRWRTEPWSYGLVGTGTALGTALGLAFGYPEVLMYTGAIALAVGLDLRRISRRGTTTIDVHERGLRLDRVTLTWDEIQIATIDATADQRRRSANLVLELADRRVVPLRGDARSLCPLADAIADGVVTRQGRRAEDDLERGGALTYGRRHRITSYGLVSGDQGVPWRDLGPARRADGALIIDAALGAFRVPIAEVPNPWVIEALVAARGRAASR